jgi:hypothetical protein
VPAFHTIASESQLLITGSRVGYLLGNRYLLGDHGRSAHGEVINTPVAVEINGTIPE